MTHQSEPRSVDVAELLDGYTPLPRVEPAWHDVDRRSRLRLRWVGLLVVVALILVVPALAFSGSVRTLIGLGHPEPLVGQATLLLSAPIGNGFWAHAWTAPASTGGQCDFMSTDRQPIVQAPPAANGGSMCSGRTGGESKRLTRALPGYPLTLGMSMTRLPKSGNPDKWVPPIVHGAVLPSLKAVRVAVVWNGGSLALRLRDDYFLGGSPLLYMPPFKSFPFTVVAYDATGRKVAEKRLESPALRLMNGWKEYTPAYNEWKRTRDLRPITPREWRAVIDDWYDNGRFDRAHRCGAIREAIERLPIRDIDTVRVDLLAQAEQVC